jgi:hypothetical protein
MLSEQRLLQRWGRSVPSLADWFGRVYGVREATLVEVLGFRRCDTASIQAALANPARSSRRRSALPSRPGRVRPGGANPGSTRSAAPGLPQHFRGLLAVQAQISFLPLALPGRERASPAVSRLRRRLRAAAGAAGSSLSRIVRHAFTRGERGNRSSARSF